VGPRVGVNDLTDCQKFALNNCFNTVILRLLSFWFFMNLKFGFPSVLECNFVSVEYIRLK
jgi:hypothetical protein